MARGKKHPLEKAWKKTFEEFKFGMPYWLPWYAVDLKRIPGGIEVGGLKVRAVGKDEMRDAAWGIVNIINEQGWKSPLFLDALVESVGGVSVSAKGFRMMSERSFYPDKTLDEVGVDEEDRWAYVETSKGFFVMHEEERDFYKKTDFILMKRLEDEEER